MLAIVAVSASVSDGTGEGRWARKVRYGLTGKYLGPLCARIAGKTCIGSGIERHRFIKLVLGQLKGGFAGAGEIDVLL